MVVSTEITTSHEPQTIYILITQCLQNGFFLDGESRLCLPIETVQTMLIGSQDQLDNAEANDSDPASGVRPNRRLFSSDLIENGPLYSFFRELLSPCDPSSSNTLHVIHVRDWHEEAPGYDAERRRYGDHLLADSWSAAPIVGLEPFLHPWENPTDSRAARTRSGYADSSRCAVFYDVRSDSVFDFKPGFLDNDNEAAPQDAAKNELDLAELARLEQKSELACVLDHVIGQVKGRKHIYLVVLGVSTDIKVQTLLVGLRSRYPIDNLIVSDVLTAAPALERHLAGLDFAQKVLSVEIIHNLNDLVSILRPQRARLADNTQAIPAQRYTNSIDFSRYQTYFLDRHGLLTYEDGQQNQYLQLIRQRMARLYNQALFVNRFLMWVGALFMLLTLISFVSHFIAPGQVQLEVTVIAGVIALLLFFGLYTRQPIQRLQENLNNLFRLRTTMETHGLSVALMRYHFSRPEFLVPDDINRGLELVTDQLNQLQTISQSFSEQFRDIQIETDRADGPTSSEALEEQRIRLEAEKEACEQRLQELKIRLDKGLVDDGQYVTLAYELDFKRIQAQKKLLAIALRQGTPTVVDLS